MKLSTTLLAVSLVAGPAWPQEAEEPARVAGSEVPAPKRIKFVSPEYPADAQARGLRGIVILELIIDKEGKVASAMVTRSVPPFDEAALAAVRRWEYEVTRVAGKPVPVRLSVPITFTMPIPRVSRQEGIPELVQGINPVYPSGEDRSASAVAELTVEASGQVAEIEITGGDPAFADALMGALRTWRFAPGGSGATVAFRVEADFVPASKGGTARVELRLAGLRRSETAAVLLPPEPSPAPTPEPSPAPTPAAPAAVPSPPPALPPAPLPSPTAATPSPALRGDATVPSGPPIEVLGPLPAPVSPQAAPAPPPEMPVSAIRDVALSAGVPDLMKGRRPVVPPLARLASATGTVDVRFAVDASGASSVQEVTGPDLLKEAARQAVASWVFRRTTADRLHLVASFVYGAAAANATVRREE
jgi:TonB family protein